ncbi:MAG: hypothetical protein ABIP48_32235 [Planctomycetota bacterium]
MNRCFLTSLVCCLAAVATALVIPTVGYAEDAPSFWGRLVENYSEPENYVIGAILGLIAAIFFAGSKKRG